MGHPKTNGKKCCISKATAFVKMQTPLQLTDSQIMPSFHFRNILAVAALAAVPLCSWAQEQAAPPPPKMELLDDSDQPAITIRKPEGEREITERRDNGRVTEIKVRSGKSAYYLHPNAPVGSALPGDAQSTTVRPAEWVVHEFDIGRNKTVEGDVGQEPVPAGQVPAK